MKKYFVYFEFFRTQDWGKRSGEDRRRLYLSFRKKGYTYERENKSKRH